ncbi:3-hydroxyacyl-CoA dehydrogenase NAD-binding domain-containing protein [Streptomyces sp. NPDC097610]|uniref:3-hydroxyacyl-CoA dehydrogenase NAD-binding domain-containing protein n=1 Tax=Streptomyces sp. NPDC097610 TaxID=3157227 RepID=UPI0033239082
MRIKRIAVAGCPTMGGGIGQLAAQNSFEVVGVECDEKAVDRARNPIKAGIEVTLSRIRIIARQAHQTPGLDRPSTDLGIVSEADLVVEAMYKDPRCVPPVLLKQYVRLGRLGRRSERGFHHYGD